MTYTSEKIRASLLFPTVMLPTFEMCKWLQYETQKIQRMTKCNNYLSSDDLNRCNFVLSMKALLVFIHQSESFYYDYSLYSSDAVFIIMLHRI